ncbi:uncharacterized protein LOC121389984 [Gigantopelta aegis]|uniref:uncharacterized protein LOC121389984 n=1 Tax=Gigantopelta aegis TaxID=1735272 RepID=UPI001B8895A2|nr:uncharacterized protein LOC121389984 [Gigantopelta aegis]
MVTDLMEELKTEVAFLSGHLFRADWQHLQFKQIKDVVPFPADTICMVMDFAENFTCMYQQEVQAAHWHHELVTVHPTVTYYRCPVCQDTTTESLVFISSDKKHDYHAVQCFTIKALQHLREKRGLTVGHIVQWTDGCGSQYKSRGPFSDISRAVVDLDATLERHFFGSRHGKGPSDGESAVVKHHAASAVAAGSVIIASAEDLFSYCSNSALNKQPPSEGCIHFLRSFFWVGERDVKRDRMDRDVKTVPGTRSFHSVKSVEKNIILTRELTCCCLACQTGDRDCISTATVGPWSSHVLRPDSHQQPTQPADADDVQSSGPSAVTEVQFSRLSSSVGDDVQLATAAIPSLDTIEKDQASSEVPQDASAARFQYGSWVNVKFGTEGSKQQAKFYNGMVLQIDGRDIQVTFLRNRGSFYSFPVSEDIAWVSAENVECITPPTINSRGQHFFP